MKVDPGHAAEADWLRLRLEEDGEPTEDCPLAVETERVRLYGCRYAAATFGVEPETLLPQAEGIVDPGWFLRDKAVSADHTQYF